MRKRHIRSALALLIVSALLWQTTDVPSNPFPPVAQAVYDSIMPAGNANVPTPPPVASSGQHPNGQASSAGVADKASAHVVPHDNATNTLTTTATPTATPSTTPTTTGTSTTTATASTTSTSTATVTFTPTPTTTPTQTGTVTATPTPTATSSPVVTYYFAEGYTGQATTNGKATYTETLNVLNPGGATAYVTCLLYTSPSPRD